MSEFYEGRQFVGMDLHRRCSVLVRMSETGEHLETVRILNDRDSLAEVMSRAGESPEAVLEEAGPAGTRSALDAWACRPVPAPAASCPGPATLNTDERFRLRRDVLRRLPESANPLTDADGRVEGPA